jgi:hypothetical protein
MPAISWTVVDERTPRCHAWSMTDKPRYSIRENSAALSRLQWWIVGVGGLVIAFSIVLALTGGAALGGMLMSLAVLVNIFTVVIATGRGTSK